ncbi:MAG: helix-turn-helix transcriptional regulator [Clostridia bacterium]|nr:helix-turn-helix transcriptional regulator [Clostridia bacterium]
MDYVGLGKRIRTQRKMMDMTQEELAAAIDVSTSFVGHIERGTRKLSVDTLVKLADALKTSCDQLLQDSLDQTVSRRNNNSMNKNAKMLLREIVNMLDEEE